MRPASLTPPELWEAGSSWREENILDSDSVCCSCADASSSLCLGLKGLLPPAPGAGEGVYLTVPCSSLLGELQFQIAPRTCLGGPQPTKAFGEQRKRKLWLSGRGDSVVERLPVNQVAGLIPDVKDAGGGRSVILSHH